MSNIYFTSDLHIGHKSITKYRPEFQTMEEHDDYMIDKILELKKRDVLYVVGDFLFDGPHYDDYIERLSKKKCRIKLIMGNHDSKKLYKEDIFEMQLSLFCYKSIWISHVPIHPDEIRGRLGCIHGHLHKEVVQKSKITFYGTRKLVSDPRYFNVNIDAPGNDYNFVDFDKIKKHFDGLK